MSSSNNNSTFTQQDVEILNERIVYQGFFAMRKYQLRFRLFEGDFSAPMTREVFERDPAVAVLPYDPITDRIVLVEQFRVGALNQGDSPWLLELLAGMVEKGESFESVAYREAKEEAGLTLKNLVPICNYFSSPGGSSEKVQLFCAKVDTENVEGIFGVDKEHEDIKVSVHHSEDAFDKVSSGEINTCSTIIALQWLQLNKTRLQKAWR